MQEENFWDDEKNDNEIDYEEFSDNFEFFNSVTCWVCNGYYGASFNEPLCGTCHSFIFPSCNEAAPVTQQLSDEEDSGNDEPPYNLQDKERQEREEARQERQQQSPEDDEFMYEVRPIPIPPRSLNQYFDLLSQPRETDNSQQQITCLPVEVLLSIFSYLDDLSLCNVSEVCKHWKGILKLNTSQQMWKKYTKERWPLFQSVITVPNWLDKYTSLMSSCFCRTCLIQMAVKTPHRLRNVDVLRINRLRNDIRSLDREDTEGIGIDAVPLDNQLSYWQASILGPDGSPYEGGKFFLFIVIPYSYPMLPPTVRFLTKIVHPNISRHGDVGIDIIQHNWSLILTISKLLLSVQSLLTDPFTEVCMEPELGRMYDNDPNRFAALARRWTWKYAMQEYLPD